MLEILYFLQNCKQWFQSILLLQLVVRNWRISVNLVVCSSVREYLLHLGLQAPSSLLKWMAEQNFYNILHAFLQMLTTSFLHVEYRNRDATTGKFLLQPLHYWAESSSPPVGIGLKYLDQTLPHLLFSLCKYFSKVNHGWLQ